MTSALLKSCRTKNKLYKSFIKHPTEQNKSAFIKHPTEQNKSAFISYRNGFGKLKMAAKKSHYNYLFSEYKCSLHKTWNLTKSLIGHKTGSTDNTFSFSDDNDQLLTPCEVANKFNQHFSIIGKRITENILASTNDSFHSFLNQPQLQSMSFLPTLEIIKFAHSLNTSHSCGIDNIDPCIAHEFISLIAEPISSIFNCSFRTGIIPLELKSAKVIPLFKSGDHNDFNNCRPISILPYFSKLIENIVHNRLYDYFDKFNLLNTSQFGFRKNHSTYMPLLLLQSAVSDSIDVGDVVLTLFLDLQKAFDTVNHHILLQKLENHGIRGIILNWFSNYLSERSQRVFFNNVFSEDVVMDCGVPQGSVLGPLLFIIYMNDFSCTSKMIKLLLYADDITMYISGKDVNSLICAVNNELVIISNWFVSNHLFLNLNKSSFIIFHSSKKSVSFEFPLSINNSLLNRVTTIRYLGILMDEHLTWSKHITHIQNLIAKNIGIISRIQIHSLQIGLFMFSCDHNALPKIFTGFFSDNNYNKLTHFLRSTHEYSLSFAKSTFKLFSIQCFGPRLYSTIPISIKDQFQSCPFNILYLLFKKSYKLYILRGIL